MPDPYAVEHSSAVLELLQQFAHRHYSFEERVLHELAVIKEKLVTVQDSLNADDAQLKTLISTLGTVSTNLTNWFAANPNVDTSAVDGDVAQLASIASGLQAIVPVPATPAPPVDNPPATPPADTTGQ